MAEVGRGLYTYIRTHMINIYEGREVGRGGVGDEDNEFKENGVIDRNLIT